MGNGKRVLISRMIAEEGADVGYIFREEGDGEYSGWRFYSGEEGPLFFMEPDHMISAELDEVIAGDAELIKVIGSSEGTAYRRNSEGKFVPEESAAEDTDHLLFRSLAESRERNGSMTRLFALLAAAVLIYLFVRLLWR